MSFKISLLMQGFAERNARPTIPCPAGKASAAGNCTVRSRSMLLPAPATNLSWFVPLSCSRIAAPIRFPPLNAASQTCWYSSAAAVVRRIASFVAESAANILVRRCRGSAYTPAVAWTLLCSGHILILQSSESQHQRSINISA